MAKSAVISLLERFERDCDELFEEMLGRWRFGRPAPVVGPAIVLDRGDRYEVRLFGLSGLEPEDVEAEVTDRKLRVRVRRGVGAAFERWFSFPKPVDREAVAAQFSDGVLVIVLPIKKSRRTRGDELS